MKNFEHLFEGRDAINRVSTKIAKQPKKVAANYFLQISKPVTHSNLQFTHSLLDLTH